MRCEVHVVGVTMRRRVTMSHCGGRGRGGRGGEWIAFRVFLAWRGGRNVAVFLEVMGKKGKDKKKQVRLPPDSHSSPCMLPYSIRLLPSHVCVFFRARERRKPPQKPPKGTANP